jgi:hypothetical protein
MWRYVVLAPLGAAGDADAEHACSGELARVARSLKAVLDVIPARTGRGVQVGVRSTCSQNGRVDRRKEALCGLRRMQRS